MIKGKVKIDRKTKNLVKRLKPDDIPVILHEDIDEVAAYSLLEKKVKIVVNCAKSFTGRFPALGAKILLSHDVTIIDDLGEDIFNQIKEGDLLEIKEDEIYINGRYLCQAKYLRKEEFERYYQKSFKEMENLLEDFIENTLEYAKKEKSFILGQFEMPEIQTKIAGRHVLVVTRGSSFKKDIKAIKNYIMEVKPVIIAVDGAADALLEERIKPHIIIGDMDSVSEESLLRCDEIIVHSYPNGYAPGLERIKTLGLNAKVIACPGTSEDVALLLAYEKGAELIVSVGSHSSMLDFLEKGRKGMSSTFLVRLKIGSKLVDARGVSKLYTEKVSLKYIGILLLSALIPILAILMVTPPFQYFFYLIQLKLRVILR
ncbi:putative cytokinetic ring protein SteA [Caldicellulosiruptor naganoensis]|uniref:Cytokinetic ring protein SteA n=1 Tax=Caldicellulosiruptor naganoensis TaxID=29324 RepID=A0ABY7BCU0_9FIRM|nr:putative cytokinetic ring protein SteA [Caldicellulosiruptor naganoensis]WAM30653.1 putative cytokinetic ring protein SteA [Caldicellulosiruptor naganoensis]